MSEPIRDDKQDDAEMVKRLHATTDAAVWAAEFGKVFNALHGFWLDEGWLIGWFANAIEVGRDAGKRSAPSAGVSILKAEAPKPTMEKVFNQFEVPAMPSPEPGATPIRQAWLDMVAYHASRGLPGFCCSWAAFNNIVGALVAQSARGPINEAGESFPGQVEIAEALIVACKDIPPEFAQVVDREFWNMLAPLR